MPYKKEFARTDSLWRLGESESVKNFEGEIKKLTGEEAQAHTLPLQLSPRREVNPINRVIAIDGSTVTHQVANGYPGAEAALFNLAAIVIKLDKLRDIKPDYIPGPNEIRELQKCSTLSAVLPGRNVIRKDSENSSPKRFFREIVNQELDARLDPQHETLRETLLAITEGRRQAAIRCPLDDCDEMLTLKNSMFSADGAAMCKCGREECIYATDALRAHERFEENGSSEEAYTAFRQVVEQLTLINILRYFEQKNSLEIFRDTAFIMDGPLALFGMPAWLKQYIQREIERIHQKAIEQGDAGLLIMGVEKSGAFLDHLKALDWLEGEGPRHRLPNGTALAPDIEYIHKHIVLRALTDKPYGLATYYGRKILYKNKSGQHSVIVTPIVNEAGHDPKNVTEEAYPRIGDALDIMDELSSHLYQDAFTPLVRAHAHAAIPLRAGTRILDQIIN